jgi:hypothetical protein
MSTIWKPLLFLVSFFFVNSSSLKKIKVPKLTCESLNQDAIPFPILSNLYGSWYEMLISKNTKTEDESCSIYNISKFGEWGLKILHGYIDKNGEIATMKHELLPTEKNSVFKFKDNYYKGQSFSVYETDYTTFLLVLRCGPDKTPLISAYTIENILKEEVFNTISHVIKGKLGMDIYKQFYKRSKDCTKTDDKLLEKVNDIVNSDLNNQNSDNESSEQ